MMMNSEMIAAVRAVELLEQYRPGEGFFLATPERTLLAAGVRAALPAEDVAGSARPLAERVDALLRSAKRSPQDVPLIVGAVPFDAARPAQLVVPDVVRQAGPLDFGARGAVLPAAGSAGDAAAADDAPLPLRAGAYELQPVPEPAAYAQAVERGLELLAAGELQKVVLARALDLGSAVPIDIPALLERLARHNAHGYTFAVDVPEQRTLIGASPELLVSRSGLQVTANPLAGSVPRSADPVEDRRRAEALLVSAKDLHEHAVVVEAVAAALRPFCKKLRVPASPSLVHTETMWHLSTVVSGQLSDPSASALELALALHPTPAVCGAPMERAHAAIRELEPFDRGFYTGLVGWGDANGDGEWIVTIRCAEVQDRALRLFAGAGVVIGSSGEGELAETTAKFRTMLRAMGLDEA